jgi:hypothetical protein
MNHIFFAEPISNEKIIKGTILHTTQQPNTLPVLASEHEHTTIENRTYLLVDKQPLEFLGAVPKKNSGLSRIFKSMNTIVEITALNEVIETSTNWIRKGIQCNKGIIIKVGKDIAVVRDPIGSIIPYKISSLQPVEILDTDAILKAHSFAIEIQKAIATGQNFPGLNQQATEGTTKQFGVNDTRRLGRGKDGKLRWMDADEYAKEVSSRQGKQQPAQTTRQFKVGETIHFKGEEVKVIDHSDKVVAYKKADGSTGTFEANSYKEDSEDKNAEGKAKAMTLGNFNAKKKPAEAAKEFGENKPSAISHEAPPNAWYKEHQRIIDTETATPEYEEFVKNAEANGYHKNGNFEYSKEVKYKDTDGNISINKTLELSKFYNTETKKTDFSIDGVQTKVTYDGKEYDLADLDGKDLSGMTIRNEDGIEQKINKYDLDKYQGNIKIDENGKATIIQQGKDIGEFIPEANITQEDLLKEGTLKIIGDEIWKRTKTGDGVSFNDTLLGRVDKGIAFYKHGNEVGIVSDGYTTNIANRNNVRRPSTQAVKDTEIQKRIRKETAKLKEEGKSRQDVDSVKARIEIENSPSLEKKGKSIDTADYEDVINTFIPDKETIAQVANSYGTEEWKANIKALAEQMKVTDVQRANEIDAFNKMSKNGILKDAPQERNASEYLDSAKELLENKYREFKREQLNEKISSRKQGDTKTKFERGELAEIPVNAKAVSSKTMRIRDSEENTYQVTYAVVPMNDVIQSHESTGEEHADHPKELQARNRKTEGSKKQMGEIASQIDERVTEDSADANRGAPVGYSKDGKVYIAQGNGRTAGIKGSTGDARDTYFGLMVRKAAELGMRTKDIQPTDMLVRVLTPKHTYQDAITLGADQDTPAMPYTEVERTRAFQNKNPQGLLEAGQNINMKSIGNKPINETNVASWISDNPEIYKKILAQTGKQRAHIETSPKLQSEAINIAMMAQLKPDFIDDISARDTRTHDLVKTVTPSLVENQKLIAEGKLPENADLQNIFHNVIKTYDSIDSNTKSLMNIKNGQSDFLNDDENTADANSLLHKMKQEHLFSTTGKEESTFRDPLKVIGMIAYQQAMKPRDNEVARQQAYTQYALKTKRFAEAIKTLDTNQSDIFGSQLNPEEQKKENNKKLIQIAERVFLENKPYQSGTEELSADEQEASKEQFAKFDVYGKMKKIADKYGFKLVGEEEPETILKSMVNYFLNYRYNREVKEIQSFIAKGKQLGLFPAVPKAPATPKVPSATKPTTGLNWNKSQGQEKPGHKYLRREKGKSGKWEYIYEEPTGRQYATDEKGTELPKHRNWEQGTEVIHNGEKVSIHEMSDNIVALKKKNGDIYTANVKDVDTFHGRQKNLRKQMTGLNVSKPTPKWDELILKLNSDLEQGSKSGQFEFADNKAELERKIKYAEDERNKIRQKVSREESTEKPTPVTETPAFDNSKDITLSHLANDLNEKYKIAKDIEFEMSFFDLQDIEDVKKGFQKTSEVLKIPIKKVEELYYSRKETHQKLKDIIAKDLNKNYGTKLKKTDSGNYYYKSSFLPRSDNKIFYKLLDLQQKLANEKSKKFLKNENIKVQLKNLKSIGTSSKSSNYYQFPSGKTIRISDHSPDGYWITQPGHSHDYYVEVKWNSDLNKVKDELFDILKTENLFALKEKDITKSFFQRLFPILKSQLGMFGVKSTKGLPSKQKKQFNPDVKFNEVQEGQTKNFNANDKRVLKRGAFGKMRWFNADATEAHQQGLFDKTKTVDHVKHQQHVEEVSQKIEDTHIDSHSGQSDYQMTVKQKGKVIAKLEYSEFEKTPHINMIEVSKDHQRKGLAKKLIYNLQKKYPNKTIQWGMMTDEGSALRNSLKKTFIQNPEYKKLADELELLRKKQSEMQIQFDDFTENSKNWNKEDREKKRQELPDDSFNEITDKIYDIEKQIEDLSEGEEIIDTEEPKPDFPMPEPKEIVAKPVTAVKLKNGEVVTDDKAKIHAQMENVNWDEVDTTGFVIGGEYKENGKSELGEQARAKKERDEAREKKISKPKELTLYRGGKNGNWYTPDKSAAKEYSTLDQDGKLEKKNFTFNKLAEKEDILSTAEELGLTDAKEQALYWLVSPETYHGADKIISALKEKGFDAVHLPIGEDFSPEGKAIESYMLLKDADQEKSNGITETEAFKKWFQGSKVVDENGKPLRVFHGTTNNFSELGYDNLKDIDAFWFTEDLNYVNNFAGEKEGSNVMPVYLKIENPGTQEDFNEISNEYDEKVKNIIDTDDEISFSKMAKEKGFDGFIIGHTSEKDKVFVALDSEQIKSATGNAGTFDPTNPDITKSINQVTEFIKNLFQAREETNTNPSEAQKEAGNYKKGTVTLHGLEIAIENPKGSFRSGKDHNGKEWKVKMTADYGYFKEKNADSVQIKGKDKDEIDVFIGSDPESEKVFIVNQINPATKVFDEHKVIIATPDEKRALKLYKGSYSDDAIKRIGSIVEMDMEEFKEWLYNGDKTTAVKQKKVNAMETQEHPESGIIKKLQSQIETLMNKVSNQDKPKKGQTIKTVTFTRDDKGRITGATIKEQNK